MNAELLVLGADETFNDPWKIVTEKFVLTLNNRPALICETTTTYGPNGNGIRNGSMWTGWSLPGKMMAWAANKLNIVLFEIAENVWLLGGGLWIGKNKTDWVSIDGTISPTDRYIKITWRWIEVDMDIRHLLRLDVPMSDDGWTEERVEADLKNMAAAFTKAIADGVIALPE